MPKPKVAFYWCASCGGCEEAIIDLNEDLLTVAGAVDIIFWPCAMDFKYSDVHALADKEIDICFINGAIQTSEHLEMAELLRRKSKILISFGACSQLGGIPGLANFWNREAIFRSSYLDKCPSVDNPDGVVPQTSSQVPEGELTLPAFHNTVKSTDQVVDIDYYLPGCSPAPHLTLAAVMALLGGEVPPKGTVLAPNKALCDTCPRADTKPEKLMLEDVKRISLHAADPEKCLLAQGFICMGPVTRTGCSADGEGRCIAANMPCRGCYGPPSEVKDVGAKMISALASIVGLENEETMSEADVQKLMNTAVDPAGLFYRFSLAKSMLRRKQPDTQTKE
ncbi:MAG: oxidoreductase [Candidatus Cloacimonetes bacterium]|nr:oxidoreductase [Candidatus Cloacimonadota bacterium]